MILSNPLLVSVIVPVYKVESYLEKCVNSLLNQTYQNLEIILVDDGSPDRCPAICDDFASKHENVVALHKPNGGLSDARNFGLKHAKADWIIFVDSDDYVEPEYVEDLMRLRDKYNADMAIGGIQREQENSPAGRNEIVTNRYPDYQLNNKEALFAIYSGNVACWAAPGKLFKRTMLEKYPFPKGILHEDAACMYKILDDCDVIALGDYCMNYHYVQRSGSILNSKLDARHLIIFDICAEFSGFIQEKYPDMNLLPVLAYRKSLTEILYLQKMDWTEYRKLFYGYKKLFCANLFGILKEKCLHRKIKVHTLLLCTTPALYKLAEKMFAKHQK